ncbi:hypothetical protein GGR56DRAFT_677685 [Xylariaceae sp. FL0804]|nr:hypothetical protein GGR56DRAFT_677685 [Xylariaceae sp. FL0804]
MSGSSKRVTRSRLRAAELQADRQDATINSVNHGSRAPHSTDSAQDVKSLAVQIDSPRLIPGIDPGWASVSITWENVENLYFVQPAIKGRDDRDKAMIRIKEGPHEEDLRKRFDQWKKNAGKELKLSKLEFVTVVEKESESIKISDRYQSVKERKTGLVEDIIIG